MWVSAGANERTNKDPSWPSIWAGDVKSLTVEAVRLSTVTEGNRRNHPVMPRAKTKKRRPGRAWTEKHIETKTSSTPTLPSPYVHREPEHDEGPGLLTALAGVCALSLSIYGVAAWLLLR